MKRVSILIVLFLVSAHADRKALGSTQNVSAARHTVLVWGHPAGLQTSSTTAEGVHEFSFEYKDRGAGPKLTSRVVVGADGVPTRVETAGHDYWSNPVEERFALEGRTARWRNRAGAGETTISDKALYVSVSGVPGEMALLARALLAAPDRKLRLLPEGEARIERVNELKVEARGQSRTVIQYTISGAGSVWLEPDQTFFGTGGYYIATIREGWESALPALLKAQEATLANRQADLASKLARKPSGALVFRNANLFDAEAATMRPNTTVVISGNRIQSVSRDGPVEVPTGAEIIDATGKSLLPGIWDMHVHLNFREANDGLLHIAAGVTTVRDLDNDTERVLDMRRRFDAGTAVGPRVIPAGFMDGRGPYQGPTKVLVDTEKEARDAIDNYARLGYEQIKIYSSIKPELVPRMIEYAHSRGLRFSGHVPVFMTAEEVVKLGYDEIQHLHFLFLNFLFGGGKNTELRSTANHWGISTHVAARHAAGIDFNSGRVKAFLRVLKERGVVIDPTVTVFENLFTGRAGKMVPAYAPVADRMPPLMRRGFYAMGLNVPEGMDQRYRDSFKAMLKMVGALYSAGIPIVAGTDALAGFSLHRELELYAEAGIPAPKVLQLATLGAAKIMKRDTEVGVIAAGRLADVILVAGNPSSRISDIRRVITVVKDGVIYDPAPIYQAIGFSH